jgi:hypothetical protein
MPQKRICQTKFTKYFKRCWEQTPYLTISTIRQTKVRRWLCWRQSNVYAEDIQRHNHPNWMVMPEIVNFLPSWMDKTFNGINIQVECLCRRRSNVYAEDIRRHKHPSWMVMPETFNGISIPVEEIQRHNYCIQVEDIELHNHPSSVFIPRTVKCLCRRHSTA